MAAAKGELEFQQHSFHWLVFKVVEDVLFVVSYRRYLRYNPLYVFLVFATALKDVCRSIPVCLCQKLIPLHWNPAALAWEAGRCL